MMAQDSICLLPTDTMDSTAPARSMSNQILPLGPFSPPFFGPWVMGSATILGALCAPQQNGGRATYGRENFVHQIHTAGSMLINGVRNGSVWFYTRQCRASLSAAHPRR